MANLLHRTKERVLLDESKLDGRNINLEAETFKLGIDGGTSYLDRCRKDPDLPIYLYGIIQSGDKPNRNNRIYPWEYLKKECIRYMENEVKNGLSYGECFAEGHELFTKEKGWINFKDLSENAIVATMNPLTKEFEWQQITKKINYDYEGKMISLSSSSLNTLVTPKHKFFVTFNSNHNKFERVLAKDLNSSHLIPKKCNWIGKEEELITIENEYGVEKINSGLFCEFMGWWLAEGWFYFNSETGNYNFSLSQKKIENLEEIKNLLERLNWEYFLNVDKKSQENTFTITNKVISFYLSQFGKTRQKFVPNEIKELTQENINLFLECFLKGDGYKEDFYTTSKFLMNDITELLYKTNCSASITEEDQFQMFYTVKNILTAEEEEVDNFIFYTSSKYKLKENFEVVNKRKVYTNTKLYTIRKIISNYYYIADLKKEEVQYKGKVYCVEVPNHIILVKNNNRTFWSSNCDHPEESSTPMLSNACWTIEDMSFKDKDVHAKILILSAYMPDNAPGKKIRGFLLNKKNVGISSRALGSVERYSNTDCDVVAEDLEMVCWDAVSNASNFGSEKLEMVQENKKVIPNTKVKALLTESQLKGYSKGRKDNIGKFLLTEEERVYLNILGLQDFLRLYLKA